MSKGNKIILILFGLSFVGILVAEMLRPQPLNWRPDFTRAGTSPFGCYVLFNELDGLFPANEVIPLQQDVYGWLQQQDTSQRSTLMLINDRTIIDPAASRSLLAYVARGNTAFISTNELGEYLADSLGISLNTSYGITESPVQLNLYHGSEHQARPFEYDKGYLRTYFEEVANSKASALGKVRFEEMTGLDSTRIVEAPNFIRLPYGSGTFLLHTTPYAFGNYYMLGGNAGYIEAVMSYLPDQSLYWDNYLKSGLIVIDSPLRFVLAQAPLRWAYYTGILGLLLFVLTQARRKQRIIPVIEPLKNSSVAFAQTVGDLYYHNRDYADLIEKRQSFFRESLNERYRLNWSEDQTELQRKIALKSGMDEKQVGALLKYMETLDRKSSHTQEDLMELHRLLQPFNL